MNQARVFVASRRVPNRIRERSKVLLRLYFRLWPGFRRLDEYVFILSHMRSGSTLLTHLLASHPQIIGYGESGTRYRRERDLEVLKTKVFFMFRLWTCDTRARYVLEKVLHKRLLDARFTALMPKLPVKVIVLLREPEATLHSLIRPPLSRSIENAVHHYLERMDTVATSLELWQGAVPMTCLTFEDLVEHPETTLDRLTRFLDLDEPLSERYDPLPTTGMKGFGDSSDRIGSGEIVKTARDEVAIDLDSETLSRCRDAYERCLDTARRVCVDGEVG